MMGLLASPQASRITPWAMIVSASVLMSIAGWWTTSLFYAEATKVELQASAQEYAKVIREQLSTIETRLLLDVSPLATKSELTKSHQFAVLNKEFPEIVRLEVRDENGNLLDAASAPDMPAAKRTLPPGLYANFSAANDTRKVIYSTPYEVTPLSSSPTVLLDMFIPTAQHAKTMVVATLKPSTWMSERTTERSAMIDKNQRYEILDNNQNLIGATLLADSVQLSSTFATVAIDLNNAAIYLRAKRVESQDTFFIIYRALAALLAGATTLATGMLIRSSVIRHYTQTKLKKLQEKVESDSRAVTLGEMSTAIAHELNQPLGAIENFAAGCERLLKKDTTRVDDVLKALVQIRIEASRGAQVIKSIREFVKRDNAQQELVSVQGVFTGLTPLLEIQAKSSHSKLNLECRKEIHLTTNRALFEQVLLNLARNGFESMADKPASTRELSIKACASPEVLKKTALITIEDNGCGINDAIEEKLFMPFASTKPNGMGIGLSLCLSIVERQGGSIRWERREQGGTKFTLVLPKIEVEA
jgi:C4-dicarboxylate-specific signal transduction histidine kinase